MDFIQDFLVELKKNSVLIVILLISIGFILGFLASETLFQKPKIDSLNEEINSLKEERDLQVEYINSTFEFNQKLEKQLTKTNDTLETLLGNYEELEKQYEELQLTHSTSREPPYIIMEGRKVKAVFKKLDESIITWEWPADTYHTWVKQGYYTREFNPNNLLPFLIEFRNSYANYCNSIINFCATLGSNCSSCVNEVTEYDNLINTQRQQLPEEITLEGMNTKIQDYTFFIDTDSFKEVMKTISDENTSDEELIKETWNIVTQLTIYSTEIQETPRYPIETITEGGGDCEGSKTKS